MSKLTVMEMFSQFDELCRREGLINRDQAFLLQVTPAMISRYRAWLVESESKSAKMPETRRGQIIKGVKVLREAKRQKLKLSCKPAHERMRALIDVYEELNPEDDIYLNRYLVL